MVLQNSCVVPLGTTAIVRGLPAPPGAPAAGSLEPASPAPLHAAVVSAMMSSAAAERRVVRNESLQRDEVGRRESANGEECTDGCRKAAALEHDYALHVVGAPVV